MNSKEYVLNHDFGYGQNLETKKIKKLKLRNIYDLIEYVDDLVETQFAKDNCKDNYEILFKTQIFIKKIF